MRHFYIAPTATFTAQMPPGTAYHQMPFPDDPTLCLVVVDSWGDYLAQDTWEALPNVVEIYPEVMGQPIAAALARGLASVGVTVGMTHRQMFSAVRKAWPIWRS